VSVDLDADGPGMVIFSQLDDPEWRAVLRGPAGAESVPIRRVFASGGPEQGGWQGVRVPGPGRWTVELVYRGRAAMSGLAVSAVAWVAWLVAYWSLVPRRRDPRLDEPGTSEKGSDA
jgi:hypothetical protein